MGALDWWGVAGVAVLLSRIRMLHVLPVRHLLLSLDLSWPVYLFVDGSIAYHSAALTFLAMNFVAGVDISLQGPLHLHQAPHLVPWPHLFLDQPVATAQSTR